MDTTTKLSMKLVLDNDFRRVSVLPDVTFSQLLSQISSIYRLSEDKKDLLVIKYQDEEGDFCTVTTDEELEEAKRWASSQSKILRFNLSFRSPARTCPFWPGPKPWKQVRGECPGFAGRRARRQRYFELQEQGLALMKTDLNKAILVFQEQIENASPRDAYLPLYNTGCCYALLGDTTNALSFLERAVEKGMRDAHHIETDDDLVSLRNLPQFRTLVSKAKEPWTPECFGGWRQKRWEHCQKQRTESSAPQHSFERVAQEFLGCVNTLPEHLSEISEQIQTQIPVLQEKIQNEAIPVALNLIQQFVNGVPVPAEAPERNEKPKGEPMNPLEEVYAIPLKTLEEMGFTDRAANLAALDQNGGDLSAVITKLFG